MTPSALVHCMVFTLFGHAAVLPNGWLNVTNEHELHELHEHELLMWDAFVDFIC